MNCSIKNEYYTITVSSVGAELISIKANDGFEYLWQNPGEFWDSHAPLLFPACGRLKNQRYTYRGTEYEMGLHGFLKDMNFAIATREGSHITMTFSSNEESRKIYPFDFTAIADYELRGEEIIFTFKVTNTGRETMPYMFGWHPGFNLPAGENLDINDYKVYVGDVKELNRFPLENFPFASSVSQKYPIKDGAYQLSEDEIYKNDTMIFTGHENIAILYADNHPFKIEFKWSDNLPYLCIWKDEYNAAKFLCLEPWSDIPFYTPEETENFDVRVMSRLDVGKTETYSYSIKAKH